MDVKNVQEKTTAVVRSQSVIDSIEEMFRLYKINHNLENEAFWGIVDFINFIKNS
jgi:hypothetical protein